MLTEPSQVDFEMVIGKAGCVELTWNAPLKKNGVLTGYKVRASSMGACVG